MSYPIEIAEEALKVAFAIDMMVWELHPDESASVNPVRALTEIIALLEPVEEYSAYMVSDLLTNDLEAEDIESAYDHAMWFVHLWMDVDIANLINKA